VVEIEHQGERVVLEVSFTQAHLRRNLLAAVAAAKAIGVDPGGRVEVTFSPGRGQRTRIEPGVTLIDDCYNANPMSMRAALDDLAETAAVARSPRRVAILGDMLELGPQARRYHAEIGAHCNRAGIDLLIAVGPLAGAMTETFEGESHHLADAAEAAGVVPQLLAPGDVVLVKGSRAVGLELVCGALGAGVGV
jgi:UDP-N-acetylmuramoyl-tripeptide--D-alanyl-D-alanine ligase